jgi:fanconi-associated nuclease 1
MVLRSKSASDHNRVLGKKIPHPSSTNFNDFKDPPAKRLKKHESLDSSLSRTPSYEGLKYLPSEEEHQPNLPELAYDMVADLDSRAIRDSGDEDEILPSSQTDLESALPPVKTDKEAIEEYEATRRAEQSSIGGLQDRLGSRTWVKGKSSIYVDAFNLALETVLEEERDLFDDAETIVFEQWRGLSYEAQYLYG